MDELRQQLFELVERIELTLGIEGSFEDTVSAMPHAEQVVVLLYWFDLQVWTDGFRKWFTDPTGYFVDETIAALQEIGAANVADLVRELIQIVPSANSCDWRVRSDSIIQMTNSDLEAFDRLSDVYDESCAAMLQQVLDYWGDRQVHGAADGAPPPTWEPDNGGWKKLEEEIRNWDPDDECNEE